MNLGMAIGEGEPGGVVVITRRVVHDHLRPFRPAGHVDHEIAVIDAVLPFIHQHEGVRRAGVREVRHGCEYLPAVRTLGIPRSGVIPARAADPVVHRHATNSGHGFALIVDGGAVVGGAFPNRCAFATIGPNGAPVSVCSVVPVIGIPFVIFRQPTPPAPVRNLSSFKAPTVGTNQPIFVVLRVKPPGQHHLLVVVHAADAVRLGLGLGQGGQEQAGQNGDDCNDNEKFYQRKRLFF